MDERRIKEHLHVGMAIVIQPTQVYQTVFFASLNALVCMVAKARAHLAASRNQEAVGEADCEQCRMILVNL